MTKYTFEFNDGVFTYSEDSPENPQPVNQETPSPVEDAHKELAELFRVLSSDTNISAITKLANSISDSFNDSVVENNTEWPYVVICALMAVLCQVVPDHEEFRGELLDFSEDFLRFSDAAEYIYGAFKDMQS